MRLPAFRVWRTLVPVAFFAATVFLIYRYTYPLPAYTELLLWYSRLDPVLLLTHLRSELSLPGWVWLPVSTLLLTVFAGRAFCGWMCPLGGLLALLDAVKPRKAVPAWTNGMKQARYYWLAFLLCILALGSGWAQFLSPFHLLTEELSRIWLRQVPWVILAVLALGLLVYPRFWCVYLCPTGLLLSLVSKFRRRVVEPPPTCVQCGVCEKICPSGAAHPAPVKAGDDCLLCGRCTERCPVGSFSWSAPAAEEVAGLAAGPGFTRREVIRSGIAVGAAVGAAATAGQLLAKKAGSNPLRPPGAVEEDEFLARCSRCGRCIKVCPAECIKAAPLSDGPAAFLTPVIVPRDARCELTQHCQQVCPTGAIAKVPIENALIGMAYIDEKRCIGWVEETLCLLCQEQCPLHAIDSDEKHRPTVVREKCVGCGACENGCPVESPPAIVVRAEAKRRRG